MHAASNPAVCDRFNAAVGRELSGPSDMLTSATKASLNTTSQSALLKHSWPTSSWHRAASDSTVSILGAPQLLS